MSRQRLLNVLWILLLLHVVVAVVSILVPSWIKPAKFSKIYNFYVVPGPFFSDGRIVNNDHVWVTWKSKHAWIDPVNLIRSNYDRYYTSFNPHYIYKARLEQTLLLRLNYYAGMDNERKHKRELKTMFNYIRSNYSPADTDSIRIWILRKQAQSSTTVWDTLAVYTQE